MPDYDATHQFFPHTTTPVRDSDEDDGYLEPTPATGLREGLPKTYQMRHDSHYVDQLGTPLAAAPVRMIPVSAIDSPRPPSGELAELAASIGRHGLLQPLLVRPRDGQYELIAGANRLAAARLARVTEVPCFVHHVDEHQARVIGEAEGLHVPSPDRRGDEPVHEPGVSAALGRELEQGLETLGSCVNLLRRPDASLRERVAADLARMELDRARALIEVAEALAEEDIRERKRMNLGEVLNGVIAGLDVSNRLAGTTIAVHGDPYCPVRGDARLISTALAAGIRVMQALGGHVHERGLQVRASAPGGQPNVIVSMLVEGVTVPAAKMGRLFDLGWQDRPGGFAAALSLVAARRLTELQGGRLEPVADPSGFALRFVFPRA